MLVFTVEIEEDETSAKLRDKDLDEMVNLMEDICRKRNLDIYDADWERDDTEEEDHSSHF
jgi:hypothetical protein